MTQERYVELARQLIGLMERRDAIQARLVTLPDAQNSMAFSQRHMLDRLVTNTGHQLRALSISFGHSKAAMEFIATKFTSDQVEFIADQCADELFYKYAYGPEATDERLITARGLEIEEMLPILSTMVDRCATLLTAQL